MESRGEEEEDGLNKGTREEGQIVMEQSRRRQEMFVVYRGQRDEYKVKEEKRSISLSCPVGEVGKEAFN